MPLEGRFIGVVDGLLADGFQVQFRAAGRSMLPAVRDGDHLVVAPAGAREVARGDVVLAATARGLVAHRIAAVSVDAVGARTFTLRGDASLEADRPVPAARLYGRVVAVERAGRRVPLPARLGLARRALVRLRPVLAAARAWLGPGRTQPATG
jgi:hypothetical protein